MSSEGTRLFVGARISPATMEAIDAVRPALADAVAGAGAKVRWLAPASYHITVKFLGWTRPPIVEALRDRIGEVVQGHQPLRVVCRGIGGFPSLSSPRVLWAGVEESGDFAALAGAVDEACGALGFARETRRFHPHVTVARVDRVAKLSDALLPYAEQNFSETRIDRLTLFESGVKTKASEYPAIAEWGL